MNFEFETYEQDYEKFLDRFSSTNIEDKTDLTKFKRYIGMFKKCYAFFKQSKYLSENFLNALDYIDWLQKHKFKYLAAVKETSKKYNISENDLKKEMAVRRNYYKYYQKGLNKILENND